MSAFSKQALDLEDMDGSWKYGSKNLGNTEESQSLQRMVWRLPSAKTDSGVSPTRKWVIYFEIMDMHPENTDESQKYGRIPEVWKNPRNMDESQKYGWISELWMNLESTDEPRKMGDFEMVLKEQMPW